MKLRLLVLSASFALAGLTSAPAASDPSDVMRNDSYIYNGLFAVALADEIRTQCDSIEPRIIRAISFLRQLHAHARSIGLNDDQIREFVESEAEQDIMRGHLRRYFEANGVVEGEPETYCVLGRAEIAARSQVGVLLYSR